MDRTIIYGLFLVTFVPMAVVTICMPYLTRRTESFGVSIPKDAYQSAELVRLRKAYVAATALIAVLSALIMGLLSRYELAFPAVITTYLIASFAVYLVFHKKMKALKAERNWSAGRRERLVADTAFRKQKLTYSNAWFMIPFAASLLTLVATLAMYDKMPARIPVKYDFQGHVVRWADKSIRSVFTLPVLQFYMLALFVFINTVIGRSKALIDADNPEASVRKNIAFRRRWSLFIICTGSALIFLEILMQWSFIYKLSAVWLIAGNFIVLAFILFGTAALAFTTGQGGSRIAGNGQEKSAVINRDDDRYWKLGIFYFNPDDPALFIEKRFGVGWTNNFAHPLSWVILLSIVVVPIVLVVFLAR